MPTYAIGDVQGCYDELCELLELIEFQPDSDRLWFVGDMVNRGPNSVQVLRYIMSLEDRARVVLGNHDLHLLATSQGIRKFNTRDTFSDVLDAPDAAAILDWLRHQPLLYTDPALDFTMVHAGLAPQWDLAEATALATEVSSLVAGADWVEFFDHMYGNEPRCWQNELRGWPRARFITNALTRSRYCEPDGSLALDITAAQAPADRAVSPWFEMPQRRSRDTRIVFGHWATLRMSAQQCEHEQVYHIDFGCVWGDSLAALRLDDLEMFSVPAGPNALSYED